MSLKVAQSKQAPTSTSAGAKRKRKVGSGRPRTYTKAEFEGIASYMQQILSVHGETADPRRRTDIVHAEGANSRSGTGLRMQDIQTALFEKFPGLFEHGFSKMSVAHMMVAPKSGTTSAKQ